MWCKATRMNRRTSIRHALSVVLCAVTATLALNTTYYVSASGSDDSSGTSERAAWRTLAKVNGRTFGAGDRVLFRCGDIWQGMLTVDNSGASGNPLVFGSYSSGAKPLINGGGGAAAILLNGASYVTADGLRVTNYGGANISDGDEANRDGIKITGGSNIIVRNNEVYWVEGFSNNQNASPAYSPRGTSLLPRDNNMYMVGGIYQNGSCSNVLVEDNYIHDCTCTGILMTGTGSGLVIRGNTVNNVGADGIEFWGSTNALVERNSVIFCGNNSGGPTQGTCIGAAGLAVCAIWGFQSSGMVQQFNYAERTQRIIYDGQAWDFDIGTSGGVYQYNFSRENEGGFILGGGQVCRYNVSYNDGTDEYQRHYGTSEQGFFGSTNLYNNTFYQDNGRGYTFADGFTGTVRNNIFHTNCTDTRYTTYAGTLSNNCFSGGQNAINRGSNAVTADPLLVNPGSMGRSVDSCDGLKLQSGSPCINAGMSISGNGGRDFWGTTLYNGAPDIGAHEWTPATEVLAPAAGAAPVLSVFPASRRVRDMYDLAGRVMVGRHELYPSASPGGVALSLPAGAVQDPREMR